MDEVARTIAALESRQRGRQRMGALANAMAGPRAPATIETAVRQRWEDPNRLAAAQAGTKLIHQGMVNIMDPRPTVPTEQQGALEHAENQQHARAQMGLGPDLGGTVTPQMRLQAESMDPSLMAMKGGKLAAALAGMVSWHGGPNKWAPEPGFPKGRPRLDKIGTGEGAQAYGHGFYSADAKGVGMDYKQRLERTTADIEGVDLGTAMPGAPNETVDAIAEFLHQPMSISNVRARLRPLARDNPDDKALKSAMFYLDRAAAKHGTTAILTPAKQGSLYKLDIPDADVAKFLDWDAPLSEQPGILAKFKLDDQGRVMLPNGERALPEKLRGEQLYRAMGEGSLRGPEGASQALQELGIPGNKYFDQMSRKPNKLFVNGEQVTDKLDKVAADMMRIWKGRKSRISIEMENAKAHGLSAAERADVLRRLDKYEGADIQMKADGTRNYVVWDQDVLDRTKMMGDE